MSPITFNCPSCSAPVDYTGKTEMMIRCSHCNNVVFVPEAARQAARAASEPAPPAPAAPGVPVYYAAPYPAARPARAGAAITIGAIVFIFALTAGIGICTAGAIGSFFFLFRNHTVYTQAVTLARNDPEVAEVFGTPVSDGFFVSGETSESIGSGSARFSTSLSGPNARGQMDILGSKHGDEWQVESISIYLDGERVLYYDSDRPEAGFERQE